MFTSGGNWFKVTDKGHRLSITKSCPYLLDLMKENYKTGVKHSPCQSRH